MLAWAAGLTVWNAAQERRTIERGLVETAEALTLAVDQSLRLTIEGLSTLTLSRALAAADYHAFRHQAALMVRRHPEWTNVVLIDPFGRQIVDTAAPADAGMPAMGGAARESFLAVMATGLPVVSDVFSGEPQSDTKAAVAVPVFDAGGQLSHVLMAGIRPERLADLLRASDVPQGWVAAVLDRDLAVVARSLMHEELVGQEAPDWFTEAVAGQSKGVVVGRSMHSREFTYAFNRSAMSGWTVAFGAPQDAFLQNLRRTIVLTAGFGLVMLAVSVALAAWIANRILGPVRALSAAASPFVPREEALTSVYAITELDELHRALDGLAVQLSASEARFRAVFEVAPVMLFVLDEDARLVEVNDAWLRTMGYGRDEVLGRQPWDFQTEESRMAATQIHRPELLATGIIDDVTATYVTKDGDIRDVLVSLRGEKDAHGTVCRTIGALRDVTEQRRIEKALTGAVEAAGKANDAKSRFLAAASHDLRQPLQALSLYLGVLTARLGESEKTVMTAVGQCVDSLSGLLNDLLDVARLDAGTIVPKVEDVPVSRLLERVLANWSIQAEEKGLRLSVVPCGAVVRTDPALMERVLSNLVANAVRYTESGRVVVGCRRVGDRLRLEVWDTGMGIPADRLDDIFDEFFQLGNPERRRDKGTGLGLAIIRRIANLLGHEVSVRSTVGKGSVFSVTLPSVGCADRAMPDDPPSVGRSRRILVVEDEVHVRSALELVLSGLGHDVSAGETVEDALRRLGSRRPELVIADYRLGGGATGVDAIRRVRALFGGDVPAVVLTGDTDPAIIRQIAGEGLHLLHKPLQIEALRHFLGKVA